MKKVYQVVTACLLLLWISPVQAEQIVKPHNFTAGTPALADEVNANFDTVYNQVNRVGTEVNVDTVNQRVGIGTVTPAEKLDVAGKIKGQELQVTNGAVEGYVLTSDSLGNAGWQVNDADPANELNTSVTMTDTTLSVNDGGGAQSIDLAERLTIGDLVGAEYTGFNIFLGYGAGTQNINNNSYNTGIGYASLGDNTSGFWNTAYGPHSLFRNTTGYYNTAHGAGALYSNTTGIYNVGLGAFANYYNQGGGGNVAVGHGAGMGSTPQDLSGNVFLGYRSGYSAGGGGNVFLGYMAGYSETGSNKLYIDNSGSLSPLIYGDFALNSLRVNGTLDVTGAITGSSFVGDGSGLTNVSAATASSVEWANITSVPVGIADGDDVNDADSDPANELQTWSTLPGIPAGFSDGIDHVDDGDNNPANELNTSVTMTGTVLSVNDAGGAKSVEMAEKLALNNLSDARYAGYSLFLGNYAGSNDDGSNKYNVGVGNGSLSANTTGYNNTAIGYGSLYGNISGGQNTASGSSAIAANTTGTGNSAHGYAALNHNITGNFNTASGSLSLFYNTDGSSNIASGYGSLFYNSSGVGNIGIGNSANYYNQTGSNNTIIGNQAGIGPSLHSKSGNVFLGYQAGYNETGSDKLYIDNSSTTSPLIYGDFANDALTVNGTMAATGNAAFGTSVSPIVQLYVVGDTSDVYTAYFRNTATSGTGMGVYANSDGVTGGTNYGVYALASGGATNYAGYFGGDARVTGTLSYGTLSQISDRRVKENIIPVENALAKVVAINGVYYNKIETPDITEIGVIAQEVQEVLPEAVSIADPEEGYLGVSYTSLVPVLIEAVKELKTENDAKDNQIAALTELVCQDHPEAEICK